MVKKGIISNINLDRWTAEVIIPELDNVVTPMIPIAREISFGDIAIGSAIGLNCVVALFSENFADGAVISIF